MYNRLVHGAYKNAQATSRPSNLQPRCQFMAAKLTNNLAANNGGVPAKRSFLGSPAAIS